MEAKKKKYLNTRAIFHSNILRELFAKGAAAEALRRDKQCILFRLKSPETECDEFYELSIAKVYKTVEEVSPNWREEFEDYLASRAEDLGDYSL